MGWQSPSFKPAAVTIAMEVEVDALKVQLKSSLHFMAGFHLLLMRHSSEQQPWDIVSYSGISLSSLANWMKSFRKAQAQLCVLQSGTDVHSRRSYQVPLPFGGSDKQAVGYDTVWYVLWEQWEHRRGPWHKLGVRVENISGKTYWSFEGQKAIV